MSRPYVIVAVTLAVLATVATGCSDDEPRPGIVQAGQVDIQLPEGWTVTDAGAQRPPELAAAGEPTGGTGPGATPTETTSPPDTVPLASEDPQTAFFQAVGVFQQCMDDNGTTFIGVPDASNPNSPANDPEYLEVLGTCAAKSNILQAMEQVRVAEAAMTPAEIEEQNEQYLEWRDCMIGRGWGIPEPTPDAEGRLFSLSGAGQNGGASFDPPAGESILDSDDLGECIEEVSS